MAARTQNTGRRLAQGGAGAIDGHSDHADMLVLPLKLATVGPSVVPPYARGGVAGGTARSSNGPAAVDGTALAAGIRPRSLDHRSCAWRWRTVASESWELQLRWVPRVGYYRSICLNLTLPGGMPGRRRRGSVTAECSGREAHGRQAVQLSSSVGGCSSASTGGRRCARRARAIAVAAGVAWGSRACAVCAATCARSARPAGGAGHRANSAMVVAGTPVRS